MARKRPVKAAELVDVGQKRKFRGGVADPRQIEYLERQLKAVELRKMGFTYEQIGKQIGYTAEGARQLILSAIKDRKAMLVESVDELRQMQFERLEAAYLRLQPQIARGDTKAINTAVNLFKRQAALLGLDVTPEGRVAGDDDDNVINGVVEVYVPDNARGS